MTTALKTISALLTVLLGAASTSAQSLPEGYNGQTRPLPANAGSVLSFSPGLTIWFDGTDLMLQGGGQLRSLLHFNTSVFGSFTLRVGQGHVLFGESSTGDIWLVSLNGAPPSQPLTNLAFNYDAVVWDAQSVIVSAKTSGFGGPDNDLFALDLQTGNTQLLAQLPGASGPVAVDGNGNLYYATSSLAFPTPPGQTDVLRFPHAVVNQALVTQQVLGLAHAQVALAGLDSASDLAFDDDGDLFFVDWFNSTIGEIDDAVGPTPTHKTLIDYAAASFSGAGLQFRRSSNHGVFEPFQPFGSQLLIHESSFGTLSQLRTVSARTASLTSTVQSPIPAGPFALRIGHGPANGFALVAIALPGGTGLTQLAIAGFEQPLFWHTGLLQPINTHFVAFDANGNASLPLLNPGFTPALGILSQAAFVDAQGATIGATAARPLVLTH